MHAPSGARARPKPRRRAARGRRNDRRDCGGRRVPGRPPAPRRASCSRASGAAGLCGAGGHARCAAGLPCRFVRDGRQGGGQRRRVGGGTISRHLIRDNAGGRDGAAEAGGRVLGRPPRAHVHIDDLPPLVDGAVDIGPGPGDFHIGLLNGQITKGKFCWTRPARLTLAAPRCTVILRQRTWRAQRGYPPDEAARQGGGDEAPVAHRAAGQPVPGRAAALGPGLPAAPPVDSGRRDRATAASGGRAAQPGGDA
jgi:hypothetical protein